MSHFNEVDLEPIDDSFPKANFFNIHVIHSQYVDIIHYFRKKEFYRIIVINKEEG